MTAQELAALIESAEAKRRERLEQAKKALLSEFREKGGGPRYSARITSQRW
jgi:hypothetical protein